MPGGRMPAPAPPAEPIAPEGPEAEGDVPMMPRNFDFNNFKLWEDCHN